jgi:peroxiredoxin
MTAEPQAKLEPQGPQPGEASSLEERDADVPGLSVSVGGPIPSVGLRASDGYLLNLRSFVGKQPVAFLFFAAPTASGAQARRGNRMAESLGGGARRLAAAGVAVVGVTCDNERQQADWIAEHRWPYLLYSDERRSAVERLGIPLAVSGSNYNVARPLFLIVGRDGLLNAIILDPEPEYMVDIVLAAVRRAEGRDPDLADQSSSPAEASTEETAGQPTAAGP